MRFRPQLIFKGGTSLSKAYQLIERFSEDVDLSLSRRDLGFADGRDPEQPGISKKEAHRRLDALVAGCHKAIRDGLLPGTSVRTLPRARQLRMERRPRSCGSTNCDLHLPS